MTNISKQPPPKAKADLQGYMNNHPNVANDRQNLRAPLSCQRNQCGLQLPVSNMLMGLGSFFTAGLLPYGGG